MPFTSQTTSRTSRQKTCLSNQIRHQERCLLVSWIKIMNKKKRQMAGSITLEPEWQQMCINFNNPHLPQDQTSATCVLVITLIIVINYGLV